MGRDAREPQPPVNGEAFRACHHPLLAPLVVVSGPSGVGKTTVVDRLLAGAQLPLRRAVTATTRPRRANEENGRDYHFWGEGEFRKAIDDGRMLEWAVVFGRDFYGTPRSEVDPHRAEGRGVILVIDVQGAANVRQACPDCLLVFIEPPSFEELEARLRGRQDMPEERVLRRLKTARDEMARAGEFHHRIVNRDLTDAVRELEHVIRERFNQ
ncbi:guanylate kinase [Frigoriglobus tundricola]|uniref:Guanylate kinase n=1 Tax=Frigoriglobus tundricola TaxID=2774151 RepID=A0A6M5YF58_9BACT|nr:guanylate kinase [Frigoriglobus tundricola]QJW92629.1 Guanylate kinase [Frigoriglobus tundricola]